jgi:hypothetical protein
VNVTFCLQLFLYQARLAEKSAAEAKAAAEVKAAASKEVETKISAAPSTEKGSGFGVVSGQAKGGKVLPAETLDLSTLDFLASMKLINGLLVTFAVKS